MAFVLFLPAVTLLTGCNVDKTAQNVETPVGSTPPSDKTKDEGIKKHEETKYISPKNDLLKDGGKPEDIAVLVNKKFQLPSNFKPSDLVEPNVPFIFKEKDEKRLMRQEAAQALEKLFAEANKDGIHLAGVSAYRSYATQQSLFTYYVNVQGEEAARKYSAEPGHSEHQTGLAIDVSGSTGQCAVEDCFADTPEAAWLAKHAPEFGFMIRYPKGKESITGYNYEPWHIRYVGTKISKEIAEKGITLEEYLTNAVLVAK
ncbi:M15 family metallopeptidase [Effusibacillus consociatus]|uniref:D-alanyl-D-alanine carboxypeptidase family protein n=1 Tax=Effusibacillus consociatus TaxID=1117041 RepID=A0ABV9Q361_9BACL